MLRAWQERSGCNHRSGSSEDCFRHEMLHVSWSAWQINVVPSCRAKPSLKKNNEWKKFSVWSKALLCCETFKPFVFICIINISEGDDVTLIAQIFSRDRGFFFIIWCRHKWFKNMNKYKSMICNVFVTQTCESHCFTSRCPRVDSN